MFSIAYLARSFVMIALLVPVAVSAAESAQSYPSKPIRLVNPFSVGGAGDIMARIIGQKIMENWRQQVVVESRPGAGGTIGTEYVVRAAPDGYTIILVAPTLATYPSLYRKPSFDPVKDLAPVTLLSTAAFVLVVHPSVPAKSVKELIAAAKSNSAGLTFASSGTGAGGHLSGELFKSMAGIKMVHVAYKGSSPALVDLIAGHTDMMFSNAPSALPHVKTGKVRALAVTTPTRSALLPQLPTVSEAGVPGYEVIQWNALLAPAGTPQAIVDKLSSEVSRVLKLPDVNSKLVGLGFKPEGSTSRELGEHIKAEIAKWAKVIKAAGIRLN